MEFVVYLTIANQVLGTVNNALGLTKKLTGFVEDDMAAFLTSMGEVECDRAAKNLQDLKRSNDPSFQVRLAIGHLETAYGTFLATEPKGLWHWYCHWAGIRNVVLKDAQHYKRGCEGVSPQGTRPF